MCSTERNENEQTKTGIDYCRLVLYAVTDWGGSAYQIRCGGPFEIQTGDSHNSQRPGTELSGKPWSCLWHAAKSENFICICITVDCSCDCKFIVSPATAEKIYHFACSAGDDCCRRIGKYHRPTAAGLRGGLYFLCADPFPHFQCG